MKQFIQDFLKETNKKKIDKISLDKLKVKLAKKHKIKVPKYNDILINLSKKDRNNLKWIVNKPGRIISGVAPISIMSKPTNCPLPARCTYCPGGIKSPFGNTPKSYTGNEPASKRAKRNEYDAYLQVMNRLEQYIINNHMPEKVELIIQGGTFPAYSKQYQQEFVASAFKAMNDFSKMFFTPDFNIKKFREFFMLPADIKDYARVTKINSKLKKLRGIPNLEKEKKKNEKAIIRCIGLTIETRPDYGLLQHGKDMLELGTTRIELGIQSVYDDVLEKVKRGHDNNATVKSIAILKDLGFKINAHYMLGLPSSSKKMDLAGLKELFSNPRYRPDMLKIYPCLVMKGTELYDSWKDGSYKAMKREDAIDIISNFKRTVPEYCRIMRIQRDIPTNVTEAGVDKTNLRQYVKAKMEKEGWKCRCIRYREAGRASKIGKISISVKEYQASNGKEFFIEAEDVDNDVLLGFCRLRFPAACLLPEITNATGIIRELHVYGKMAAIGSKGEVQHKGIGSILLKKAEEIALSADKNKMLIISGIGVRQYYRKFGYKLESNYMSKQLS